MKTKPKRIGLALGSGGARGWAHIGAIQAIREQGIHVHCVSGTSMGALVGAAFASGNVDDLHEVALHLDWKHVLYHFIEFSLPRTGLIDGTRVVEFLKEHVSSVDIPDLPMPFAAVATDILTGKEVVLQTGNLIDAVRASIAIPGMFTPLARNGELLVDGGLVNPLPVNIARALNADFVIAVDITRAPLPRPQPPRSAPRPKHEPPRIPAHLIRNDSVRALLDKLNISLRNFDFTSRSAATKWFPKDNRPNIFDIYGNATRIIQMQITAMRLKLEPPDLLIQPDVQDISTMDFHRAPDAIQAGYDATRKAIKDLRP